MLNDKRNVGLQAKIKFAIHNGAQGPVSRKPRKLFRPVQPFLVHLYLKTEKCIRVKLLV